LPFPISSSFHFTINAEIQNSSFFITKFEFKLSIVPEQEAGFSDRAVSDDEKLEHVVEVLIRSVFLP
jgi:hypothetical protein